MSTYKPEELLSLWQRGSLDLKMAIGHILQHLVKIQKVQDKHHATLYQLQAGFETLKDQNKPSPGGKKQSPGQGKPDEQERDQ